MLLLLLLTHWELLCKHCKIALMLIAGWKGRTRSYHYCWWIFNWIIRKKRAEGEFVLLFVLPEYLVALLPTTSIRYCRSSHCHCCVCSSSTGWSWSGGTSGTKGKTFPKFSEFFFDFVLALERLIIVKVVCFSFPFLLSRNCKEY